MTKDLLTQIAEQAIRMRERQKAYNKRHTQTSATSAKHCERTLDFLLARYIEQKAARAVFENTAFPTQLPSLDAELAKVATTISEMMEET